MDEFVHGDEPGEAYASVAKNIGYLLVGAQRSRVANLDPTCHQTQVAEISNTTKIRRADLSTTKDEALCSSG